MSLFQSSHDPNLQHWLVTNSNLKPYREENSRICSSSLAELIQYKTTTLSVSLTTHHKTATEMESNLFKVTQQIWRRRFTRAWTYSFLYVLFKPLGYHNDLKKLSIWMASGPTDRRPEGWWIYFNNTLTVGLLGVRYAPLGRGVLALKPLTEKTSASVSTIKARETQPSRERQWQCLATAWWKMGYQDNVGTFGLRGKIHHI